VLVLSVCEGKEKEVTPYESQEASSGTLLSLRRPTGNAWNVRVILPFTAGWIHPAWQWAHRPCLSLLADMVTDGALPKLCLLKVVARQPQSVVKIACRRHGRSPFVFWWGDKREIHCLGDDFSIPDSAVASPASRLRPILDAQLRPTYSFNW